MFNVCSRFVLTLLSLTALSACHAPGSMPSAPQPMALRAQNASAQQHQATGVFEYREMVAGDDIDIHQVARRFLWKYEPSAVDPEPYLSQLPAAYPIRRYEITFSGPDAAQVNHALQSWIQLFKEHGGAL